MHTQFSTAKFEFLIENVHPDHTDFDFIQLSSGTTATSKAFCLKIRTLIKSAVHIQDVHHIDSHSLLFSYLTFSHIFGFVSGFVVPLITDSVGIYSSTALVKNRPSFVLDLISDRKVSHCSVIINTIENGLSVKNKEWDFSSLKCMAVGGEKIDSDTFENMVKDLGKYKMKTNVLVNSYGMSENGAITMENPYEGNSICSVNGMKYVSVGNSIYHDMKTVIIDENEKVLSEKQVGMIGILSDSLARYYIRSRAFYELNRKTVDNESYYFNGDCGFIYNEKLYVTGRKINTLTYNGLKIESEIINSEIKTFLRKKRIMAKRCFCFNYPGKNNFIVCFIDCEKKVSFDILDDIKDVIQKKYHLYIQDFIARKYEGKGIDKISMPEVIKIYNSAKL